MLRTTLRGAPVVAAPGKVFLIGEYAVLEQAPAVVAAVSCWAYGQYMPELPPASPVVAEAVRGAAAALGELAAALPNGAAMVDSGQFSHGDVKLGFGSSAATAVAAVGAVFEYMGRPVAEHRDDIFAIADAAHRAAQRGVGSGADIAAATYGGWLRYRRPHQGPPVIEPLTPPRGLELRVFWTGAPASTTGLVGKVLAFAQRTPPFYRWIIDEMRGIATRFGDAFAAGDARGAIDAAHAYLEPLDELAKAAEVEIVTSPFRTMAQLARSLGGAAKPSGAGGGDIGIALFDSADAARELTRRCPPGVSMLDVRVDPQGVRRRMPGAP